MQHDVHNPENPLTSFIIDSPEDDNEDGSFLHCVLSTVRSPVLAIRKIY
jgi:hypothetical protein